MTHINVPTNLPTSEEREEFYDKHVQFVKALFKPLDQLAEIDQHRFEITQTAIDLASTVVRAASLMDAMLNYFVSPLEQRLDISPSDRWDHVGRMRNYGLYLNHTTIGNLGEVGEMVDCIKRFTIYCGEKLNLDNLQEEMGDLIFFMTTCRLFFKLKDLESNLTAHLAERGVPYAQYASSKMLGETESELDSLDVEFMTNVMRLIRIVYQPSDEEEVTRIYDGFILNNFTKLKARYEKGYSNAAAHARADKAAE